MNATWHFWVISESDPSDKNECHIFSEFELIGKKQGHMPTSNKNKRHMSKSAPQANFFWDFWAIYKGKMDVKRAAGDFFKAFWAIYKVKWV